MKKTIISLACAALLTACGTTTTTTNTTKQTTTTATTTASKASTKANTATMQTSTFAKSLAYIRKVNDNAAYTKNIVSKIDFTINAMGKDISVGGKLYMRKDEVVRIQLTPFGLMEVGRLEFTPDYVLLINRIDKEYVKATYSEIDFLKANGLDFYTLQSLFWNELFQPAKKQLTDSDLSLFKTDMNVQADRHINFVADKLDFDWTTDVVKAQIKQTLITYAKGTQQSSTVNVDYGDFVPLGSKRFPSKEKITFNSKSFNTGKMTLLLLLNKITNDTDWDAHTAVSDKYKRISAQQFFSKLGNM